MKIIDLQPEMTGYIEQIATMLVEAFRENWPEAWPSVEDARQEVKDSFEAGRISRVGLDDASQIVLGWIGGIEEYDGLVWELHPLVVRPDRQGEGIGRALVMDLEEQVRQRGGLTIQLGSDDDSYQTSLGGADLYTGLYEKIAGIQNLRRHPYEFYQKLGYIITGVVPDANGISRPDILMSKRVYRLED